MQPNMYSMRMLTMPSLPCVPCATQLLDLVKGSTSPLILSSCVTKLTTSKCHANVHQSSPLRL